MEQRSKKYFFSFIIFSLIFGCLGFVQKPKQKIVAKKKVVVKKKPIFLATICGEVVNYSGNFMPSPDFPVQKGAPVAREICFYKLTKVADTEGDGVNNFSKVKTILIGKAKSSEMGKFCVKLPIGKYSVFINEPNFGLFANVFDDQMNVCPIEVKKSNKEVIMLKINHSATF